MSDPLSLFGSTFYCDCGKTHHVDPACIVYAHDAPHLLPDLLREACPESRRVTLFADTRTRTVAGETIAVILSEAQWDVQELIVPDPSALVEQDSAKHAEAVFRHGPVCDDVTKEAMQKMVDAPDIILTVGGGVINDLGKWIAYDLDVPFVCFGTAASMNGYASANVAPAIQGVKTLVRARPPHAVVTSPQVIAGAPWELTASGLGDILAKSVSSADWKMNQLLFGDYYCERSVGLIADIEPLYMTRPEDLAERKPEALEALFLGLQLTGAAMTMAETSSPSSGGEHMLSHTLDMMSSVDGEPHDLHGRQVGIGTILASEVYRRVLAIEKPEFREIDKTIDADFWGPLAAEVTRHYSDKLERIRIAREKLSAPGAWEALQATITPMLRAPETIKDCLRRAGAAHTAGDLGMPRDRVLAAFRHAHEIRSRFTILDLARLVGVLPDASGEIVSTWA